jgi:hypothetical protein
MRAEAPKNGFVSMPDGGSVRTRSLRAGQIGRSSAAHGPRNANRLRIGAARAGAARADPRLDSARPDRGSTRSGSWSAVAVSWRPFGIVPVGLAAHRRVSSA